MNDLSTQSFATPDAEIARVGALSATTLRLDRLADRIEGRLEAFRTEIETKIFRSDIPLLGQGFADKAAEVLAFVDDLISGVRSVLTGIGAARATVEEIEAAFDAAANPDLVANILADGSLQLTLSEQAVLQLQAAGTLVDFGTLGLGFELDAALELSATVGSSLALVINAETGGVTVDASLANEFTVSLEGGLVPTAGARLGFLETVLGTPTESDGIDVDLTLDLVGNQALASISGGAYFSRQLQTTAPATIIPTASADFVIGFGFDAAVMTSGVELSAEGIIGLENISFDLGGLADFLNSVLGQISDIANTFPFGTILDILTTPIPVINDIAPGSLDKTGDGTITATDFILAFGGESDNLGFVAAIEALVNVLETIDELRGIADTVSLGDLVLTGEATASFGAELDLALPGISAAFGTDVMDLLSGTGIVGLLTGGTEASAGLEIPLLTDPLGTIGSLLLNGFYSEPVTLVTWDLPPMEFSVNPTLPFNVGPLAFFVGGKFAAGTDFAVGYDTEGFSGGTIDVPTGFFITTVDGGRVEPFVSLTFGMEAGGGVGVGVARVAIVGGVTGIVDLFLAGGGEKVRLGDLLPCLFDPIKGRIVAGLEVEVKVGIGVLSITERISIGETVLAQFNFDPCAVNFDPEDFRFTGTGLATGTNAGVLVLNVGALADRRSLPDRIDVDPAFADVDDATLDVLRSAGVDVQVQDEVFHVTRAPGVDGAPADPDALAVQAFGIYEIYDRTGGFSAIRANGDDGQDRLSVEADLAIMAVFAGQGGNDSLTGGALADRLDGDAGHDTLVGNDGADTLNGGNGDDVLVGGLGADALTGGAGIDEADYSASTAAISFAVVGTGALAVLVGTGGSADGDVVAGVELIKGSAFGDLLRALPTLDTALQGLAGDDTLRGGAGNDLLSGGDGADFINGGAGSDAVSYAFSDAAVLIDRRNNFNFGGEATGDTLISIESFQLTWYGDSFIGNDEGVVGDVVYAFNGDDSLDGGTGRDFLDAGEGSDTVVGRADGDTLHGGDGAGRDLLTFEDMRLGVDANLSAGTARLLLGGLVSDVLTGESRVLEDGTTAVLVDNSSFEDVTGSALADSLVGDGAGNLLQGGAGNDSLFGGGGDDTLIGGAGSDSMQGGAGRDLVDYAAETGAVDVDLAVFSGKDGSGGTDILLGIENLRGTGLGDTLNGNLFDNDIDVGSYGQEVDIVDGKLGNDRLIVNWGTISDDIEVVKLGEDRGFVRPGPFSGATYVDFDGIEAVSVTTGSGDDVVASIFDGLAIDEEELDHFSGDDYISTGAGDDTINAGSGADLVYAGADDDIVSRTKATEAQTFVIDGGAGIDTLIADLSYDTAGVVLNSFGTTEENNERSVALDGGGVFVGFEILADITTGSGDDVLTQLGKADNLFSTGDGADTVILNLGSDTIYGGESDGDGGVTDTDTLVLDFTGETELALRQLLLVVVPGGNRDFQGYGLFGDLDSNGSFESEANRSVYYNFERMIATGTENDDSISGFATAEVDANRDDVLAGAGGNDTLIGLSGDDVLSGGTGTDSLNGGSDDDTLIGGVAGHLDGIDLYNSGLGKDHIVLGDAYGTHYGDLDQSLTSDFARILDFSTADDTLQLHGKASDYLITEQGSSSRITLVETGELVAVVRGVLGLSTTAAYMIYVGADVPPLDVMAPAAEAARLLPSGFAALTAFAPILPNQFRIEQSFQIDPWQAMITEGLGDVASGLVTYRSVTVTGDLAGVGTFENAPFGLDEGYVLSTGRASDLDAPNTVDGAESRGGLAGTAATLSFVEVGTTAGGSTVYRADLSGFAGGLDSLTLADSLNLEGASSLFSGFDLDGVMLSRNLVNDVAGVFDPALVDALDVFDFSPIGVRLDAGTMRNPGLVTALAGTINGVVDETFAQLGRFDYDGNAVNGGAFSMGDGGSVTFELTEKVSTRQPLYLYVAEAFAAGEGLSGIVTATDADTSSDADASTDLGAPGAEGDRLSITTEFTLDLASGLQTEVVDLFNVVIVSEELPEFGGALLQDLIDIKVNGLSVVVLGDGRQATLQNLAASPFGPFAPELSLNPAGTGALSSTLSADGYTTILRVRAPIFDGANRIEVTVADGADGLRDSAIFLAALSTDTLTGTSGNNLLTGSDADDRILGLAGNDTAVGAQGWDTYFFARDAIGVDVIIEEAGAGIDKIELASGIAESEITMTRGGAQSNDLLLHLGGTGSGQRIVLRDHFQDDLAQGGVETLEFGNGTVIDLQGPLTLTGSSLADVGGARLVGTALSDRIAALGGDDLAQGLAGMDTLLGGAGADTLDGGDGDDHLLGQSDDDRLFGGTGNDVLDGAGDNDTLTGGEGNDTLNGGAGINRLTGDVGVDTFVFDTGFVATTITDFAAGVGGDVIVLSLAGQATDFAAFIANARQINGAVVYDMGTAGSERIVLQNATIGTLTVDNFDFA